MDSPRKLGDLADSLLTRLRLRLPPIARGMPSKYAEGKEVFDARIKARFPVGTQEEDLIAELREQGFPLPSCLGPDAWASSTYNRTLFVFRTIWSVRWRAEDGRVTEILGVYGVVAP